MTIMNYRKAISEAIRRAMIADERVVFLGEDVGSAGGAFKTTVGLKDTVLILSVSDSAMCRTDWPFANKTKTSNSRSDKV